MEVASRARSPGRESDEELRKRRKRSKDKKDKKSRKKQKSHKRSRRDSSSDEERSRTSEASHSTSLTSPTDIAESKAPETAPEPEANASAAAADAAPKMSKQAFFAQLMAKEGSKGSKTVGTVHSVGKRDQGAEQAASSGDWECYKCGTSNFRHSIECHKCKAMKRLTEWR